MMQPGMMRETGMLRPMMMPGQPMMPMMMRPGEPMPIGMTTEIRTTAMPIGMVRPMQPGDPMLDQPTTITRQQVFLTPGMVPPKPEE